jgi:hypothetical protein
MSIVGVRLCFALYPRRRCRVKILPRAGCRAKRGRKVYKETGVWKELLSYRFCPQLNSSVEAALAIFQPSAVRTR